MRMRSEANHVFPHSPKIQKNQPRGPFEADYSDIVCGNIPIDPDILLTILLSTSDLLVSKHVIVTHTSWSAPQPGALRCHSLFVFTLPDPKAQPQPYHYSAVI